MIGSVGRLPGLYARAVARSLPLVGSLGWPGRAAGELSPVEVHRVAVRTDVDRLAAYCRLTGQAVSDRLPGLYPHLAALEPQLVLLTDPGFPFAPLGLVHVHHAVVQHRPLLVRDTYDLAVRAGRPRPHRRGRLVDLETTASLDGEPVWTGTATVLARGAGDRTLADDSPLAGIDAPAGHTRWRVPASTGRAYARVSGDLNPIHLSRPTARAFGFSRPIAHGLWTAARALASVASWLPDAYRYEVAFSRPVLLPADVRLGSRDEPDGVRLLGVTSAAGERTHLVARVGPLACRPGPGHAAD